MRFLQSMRMMIFMALGMALLALQYGCTANLNYFALEQEAESDSGRSVADAANPSGQTGESHAVNVFVLKADGGSITTSKDQSAEGKLNAGWNGSNAAGEGDMLQPVARLVNDLSKKNSENPTTTTTQTPAAPASQAQKPETPAVSDEPADTSTNDGIDTTTDLGAGVKYSLSSSDGGYKTLRTTDTGASFGKSLKFVYENGYTVTIPDTSKRYEEGNRQTIYRCGGKGLPQSDERYTSHGGMGLWTLKAGSSSTVIRYVLQE